MNTLGYMLYFLVFWHYAFYIFFIMCFAAYIYAATQNNRFKVISTIIPALYSLLEFVWVLYVLFYLELNTVIWRFWIFGVALSLIITGILSIKKKADITIWVPFSLLFSPIIIIPVLISSWKLKLHY